MAIKGEAPIVPVAITGAREAMRKGSFVIQPVTVRIRFGTPLETAGMTLNDRDTLTGLVRDKVESLLAEG
jgi:1-acyl-sn-glycerol-3-phosphate acyltransferase